MRRSVILTALVIVGVFLTASTYEARQEKFNIVILEVADNLWMLANDTAQQGMRTGGNTAVYVRDDGVTLVDTKIAGYGPDIMARVREITDKPVTTIINTHTHYDHTGANNEFPDTVDFVVHENTRAQMARPSCEPVTNCEAFQGANTKYLPETTYSDTHSLFSGDDQIDLYYFGRGHTDGDTFVVFRAVRAVHTGDMFQRKGLPFIDVANGNGSAVEFGSTIQKAIAGISNVDLVITGHNDALLEWDDFVNFSGFYNDMVDQTERSHAAGRSVDEAVAAYSLPGDYADFDAPEAGLRRAIEWVYGEQ